MSTSGVAEVAVGARASAFRSPAAVVLAASFLWAIGFTTLALRRLAEYGFARVDLGFMVQAVWSTAHGRLLEGTLVSGEQGSRLSGHVDPILVLLSPATLVAPTPDFLLVVQSIALAAGAYPVFALARGRLRSTWLPVLLAFVYLANPWLIWQTQVGFYPISLSIPLILYAIWFLDGGRYGFFALAALLALMCGELVGLSFVGIGIWHAVSTRRWRIGAAIVIAGMSWTVVALRIVIPAVGGAPSPFYSHYASLGGSPAGILRTTVTDPAAIASSLFGANDIAYVFLLALPLLGVFALAPLVVLGAVPQLLLLLLSDWPGTTWIREHYVAGVLPYLFAGTVIAIAKFPKPRRQVVIASMVLAVSAGLSLVLGPWPKFGLALSSTPYRQEAHRSAVFAAIDRIPAGAPVSATNAAGVYLSERHHYYQVPVVEKAQWILIDRRDAYMAYVPRVGPLPEGRYPKRLVAFERSIRSTPGWRLVFERNDVALYRRHVAASSQ